MRLIDADCLRDYMWHICGETDEEIDKGRAKWESGLWIRYKVFEEALDKQITVEAEPVVHGRWEALSTGEPVILACNKCGQVMPRLNTPMDQTGIPPAYWRYCPACGAKMNGGEK